MQQQGIIHHETGHLCKWYSFPKLESCTEHFLHASQEVYFIPTPNGSRKLALSNNHYFIDLKCTQCSLVILKHNSFLQCHIMASFVQCPKPMEIQRHVKWSQSFNSHTKNNNIYNVCVFVCIYNVSINKGLLKQIYLDPFKSIV